MTAAVHTADPPFNAGNHKRIAVCVCLEFPDVGDMGSGFGGDDSFEAGAGAVQRAVERAHYRIAEIAVAQEAQILDPCLDVAFGDMSGMPTFGSGAVAGIICMIPTAPAGLRFDCSSPDSW